MGSPPRTGKAWNPDTGEPITPPVDWEDRDDMREYEKPNPKRDYDRGDDRDNDEC
jgi:hypothetical protein